MDHQEGREGGTREKLRAIVMGIQAEKVARDSATLARERMAPEERRAYDRLEEVYAARALELILQDVEAAAREGRRSAAFIFGGPEDAAAFFWRGFYGRLDVRDRSNPPERDDTVWLMGRLAKTLNSPQHRLDAEVDDRVAYRAILYVSWA